MRKSSTTFSNERMIIPSSNTVRIVEGDLGFSEITEMRANPKPIAAICGRNMKEYINIFKEVRQ